MGRDPLRGSFGSSIILDVHGSKGYNVIIYANIYMEKGMTAHEVF